MMRANIYIRQTASRQRGSVYILVMGASLLVALIGISSILASRVQRRSVQGTSDMMQAKENARVAIERGLWTAKAFPASWRASIGSGANDTVNLAGGTSQYTGTDPVDGDLTNNTTDPVLLTGTGKSGGAIYILEVTLNGDGTVQPGTWKRVVLGTGQQGQQGQN